MDPPAPAFLVGVGASAGGVEGLLVLAGDLAADLPATVLVVLRQSPVGRPCCPG